MNQHFVRLNEMERRLQLLEMAALAVERRAPQLRAAAARVERNRQRIELGLEPIYQ